MKLTKQQRAIIAIFGLALMGLLFDRVFLLPKGAGADPMEKAQARRTGLMLAVDTIPEESAAGMGLKQRLNERLAGETLDVSTVRDAFTPSSEWLVRRGGDGTGRAVENMDFKKKYQLQAIMFQKEIKAVFINDEIVRVGEAIDGHELVELTETSATFSVDGIWTVLLLD